MSIVAGMNGMPFFRFLAWNIVASIAWAGLVVSAGYVFGENVDAVVSEVGLIVSATIISLAVVVWLVVRWRRRRSM